MMPNFTNKVNKCLMLQMMWNIIGMSEMRSGAWLSLVERCVRDAKAAGSNPVAPTIKKYRPFGIFMISEGF